MSETFLITGGFGGIGRVVAAHLAERAGAGGDPVNLVLCGRAALDDEKRTFIRDLEDAGAGVHAFAADVCDAAAMRRGLDGARARFGALTGAFHIAGTSGTEKLLDKPLAAFRAVLDPKVAGAKVLDEVLADDPLRFVCYFSSTSAVLGDFGACDYAVANRFLMAYADHRNELARTGERRGHAVVINWPLWRDGGMGFDDEAAAEFYLKTSGQRFLETDEALAALDRILEERSAGPHLVFAGEPDRVRRMLGVGEPAPAESPAPEQPASEQPGPARREGMRGWSLEKCLAQVLREPITALLKTPPDLLDGRTNLSDFGFDSISLGEYARALEGELGVEVTPDVFFGHSTLDALSAYFLEEHRAAMEAAFGGDAAPASAAPASTPVPTPAPAQPAVSPAPAVSTTPGGREPVAIIGMSGRFPQARNAGEMWSLLERGADAVAEVPEDRFDWRDYDGMSDARWCASVPGVAEFDPLFFEISPREAEGMDPRQRLLMQEAWNALEDAGYGASRIRTESVGMFVGVEEGDFQGVSDGAGVNITSNHTGILAARLAYFLGLRGPVMALNTACSSGLVAVHQACQSLRAGECDSALAGAVSLLLTPAPFLGMAQAGMLSPDGVCRAFDRDANGIVPGEGVAAVHLKLLSRARADGDPVHAVILGSGLNYDGKTNGITAPSRVAQKELLSKVWRDSAIALDRLGHIVTHGTGTPLGDPVEVNALADAYREVAPAKPSSTVALTSVKSSFGHGFAASGMVSLVALVQSLKHGAIPASLHCEAESTHIRGAGDAFHVNRSHTAWPRPQSGPRVGGVSAFGMSGTNAHVLVGEDDAPLAQDPAPQRAYHLLAVSAKSEEALTQRIAGLRDALAGDLADAELAQVAYTLLEGRHHMRHRCAVVVQDTADAVTVLEKVGQGARPDLFGGVVPLDFEPRSGIQKSIDLLTASLRSGEAARDDVRENLYAVADLYCQGYDVAASTIYGGWSPQCLRLPTYPFERTTYWTTPVLDLLAGRVQPTQEQPSALPQRSGARDPVERLEEDLRAQICELSRIPADRLEGDANLADLGFDSVSLSELASRLSGILGIEVTPDIFFGWPTLNRLCAYFCDEHVDALAAVYAAPAVEDVVSAPAPEVLPPDLPKAVRPDGAPEPVAIIGMSGRFPKARDIATMWDILARGEDAVDEIPAERFDWRAHGDAMRDCHWCGTVPGVDEFDPLFFEIAPREAAGIDPRQRLLLQESWKALEDAGLGRERLDRERVGVFVGVEEGDYQRIAAEGDITSNHVGVLAARLAYFLDLDGPVLALNTACSSALVALHQACLSLRAGDCDTAVVAGVNLMLTPEPFMGMQQAGMLSPRGQCRAFDAEADGMVPGEAVCAVVLRRQSLAERDGDPIRATILADGVNYDGRTGGLTAPSRRAQAELIRDVSRRAGVAPGAIGHIVTHGTGTNLGDPVEINALVDAFAGSGATPGSCALTSTKSNFGHTFAASGLVSLIALVEGMRHRTIPPSIHCDRVNDYIRWKDSPFFVNTAARDWDVPAGQEPVGAVSAFGMSGTNAHVLVQGCTPPGQTTDSQAAQLLVLSARSETALQANARALGRALRAPQWSDGDLASVGRTLIDGRTHFRHRAAVAVESLAAAVSALERLGEGDTDGVTTGTVARNFKASPEARAKLDSVLADARTGTTRLEALAQISALYCEGHDLAADAVCGQAGRRVHLPTYVFTRDRYWSVRGTTPPAAAAPESETMAPDLLLAEPRWEAREVPGRFEDGADIARELWWFGEGGEAHADLLLGDADSDDADVIVRALARLRELLASRPESPVLVQAVISGERTEETAQGLAALFTVARNENPALRGQVIAIEDVPGIQDLRGMLDENAREPDERWIRYRAGQRQASGWAESPIGAPPEPVLRADGVYLITGGAGGIGRQLARDIRARCPQAHIVLCGRSADPEDLPGSVEYRRADITSAGAVRDLIHGIVASHGVLHGVFHAAGLLHDEVIARHDEARVRDVLAPKVAGTRNLDAATADIDLDFLMLFSSLASVAGNVGQAAYAAANGFMDGFAAWRNAMGASGARRGRTVSVNWPHWREGGMPMDAHRLARTRDALGLDSIGSNQAMAALERALSAKADQVMVLTGDRKKLSAALLGRPAAEAETSSVPVDGDALRATLLAEIRDILMMPEGEPLDEEATFSELGLDSLQGARFIEALSARMGRELRETLIFDYPTVAEMAVYLAGLGAPENAVSVSTATDKDAPAKPAPDSFRDRLARVRAAHEEVVPLDIEGEGPLLFCIHPMSGDVGIYAGLADAARGRFRTIGLRARGLFGGGAPFERIEDMAAHYAALIAEVQPKGPWHLLGTSMGGTVAYETARLLRAEHGKAATVVMVEAPLIESAAMAEPWRSDATENLLMNANFLLVSMLHLDPDFRARKAAGEVHWPDLEIRREDISDNPDLSEDDIMAALVERIAARGVTRDRTELAERLRAMAAVHRANIDALAAYRACAFEAGQPKLVFCQGADGTATSDRVYNPDYLVAVQRAHGGMTPYFDAWTAVAPDMETVVLPGANHFEMLGDAATLEPLAELIAARLDPDAPAPVPPPVPTKPPAPAPVREQAGPIAPRQAAGNNAIAVIGLSGRFPGADTPDAFFRLLMEGRSAITPLPADRGWSAEGCDATHGGFLDAIDQFDPVFFRIPPKVAETLDPAERLFLMEGWRAIEDAGTDPARLAGANWGVFCGGGGDYTLRIMDLTGVSPHVTQSSIPARLAYSLNLAGPSVSVDAGCASSLLAVAQACDQLVLGRCDVAVAGGVMVHSTPNLIRSDVGPGVLSRGAECHALDARADGMLPGEAVAAVVLKPLDRALADGDRIHGVIEGWGNNHSGRTNGMAAPSTRAQAALMKRVHADFGIDPATIGVIEANATGTPLGDAVEIEALGEVFGDAPAGGPRLLGTVENNIGHAYHASGMAHLFKVLLSMRHGAIPGTRNGGQPAASGTAGTFAIHDDSVAWPSGANAARRAAVNSVGATGTNVHLVMSPAPEVHRPRAPVRPRREFDLRRCWIEEGSQELKLSGRNGTAERLVAGLVEDLTGYDAGDIAYDAPLSSFGLDSLMSMRLLALINDKCGLALQLADLAEHDSVDALARLIETAAPEHHNPDKAPAARPDLSDEQRRAAGWFAERLSSLPDSLDAVLKPLPDGATGKKPECRSALAALSAAGIAVYRAGQDILLAAHDTAAIEAVWEGLSPAELDGLAAMPDGVLHVPCSDEQDRALYHSERIGSVAWNVTQIFTLSEEALDHVALGRAVAAAGRHHDLLRTRFEAVENETQRWLQVVEGRAPEMLEIVDATTSAAFYERVAERRMARIAVDRLPVARFIAARVDGRCLLAIVTHHALADAFAPPILFDRVRQDYESLRAGGSEAGDGEGECYWHYALGQFSRDADVDAKALDHWRARFDGIGASMRLPYAKAPGSVDRDAREMGDGHMLVFTPELAEAVSRFSRTHGYSFTQLFTAAVVLALREAGNPVPVVRYVHSRRDRSALLDMPGEFSNVLFLPFDIAPEASVRDLLETVKQETLDGLRASRLPFGELCGAAGIDGPEAYFRDTGDVMIDSAEIESLRPGEASALEAMEFGSGAGATTAVPETGALGQTAASLFFQLLKMGERVQIATTWRRALFEPAEMRQLTALIVQVMTRMIHAPEAALESLVAEAAEPLSALRARTDRFAPLTPAPARPRVPKAPVADIRPGNGAATETPPPFFAECQRVNPVTAGRPVFWVHGAFGDASVYRELAARLDRPFYGLQARGLIDDKTPLSGVETIAVFYADMIRTIQPHGPYDLGGYSVGGTFAYEIARQLQAAGEEVASLTLADPIYAPLHTHLGSGLYDLYAFLATGLIAMAGGAEASAAVPPREEAHAEAEIVDEFIAYCRAAGVDRPEGWIRDYLERMAAIQKGFRITEYLPQPLEQPVAQACYFRNSSGRFFGQGGRNGEENPDPLDGVDYWSAWADLLPGLEYRTVEIDSHLELFESPTALDAISGYCRDIYGDAVAVRSEHTSEISAEGVSRENLTALVAEILERPTAEVAPDRPLTDSGMDSLLATRLLQQLRERFGADLDLATMATLETLDDLAAALGQAPARKAAASAGNGASMASLERRHPELVRLNRGAGRPVFWFHGGLGSVEAYRELAEQCARPFWGIQARGWMTDREPLHGVAAMACYYVQVIQAAQPEGPYDLGGYSLGGVLAYEVTRQLQELGEHVESIVMLDSYDVTDSEPSPLFAKRCMLGAVNMALQAGLAEGDHLADRLVSAAEIDPGLDDEDYWSRLLGLARQRGLKRTDAQLRTTVAHMSKFGRALEGDGFRILPLPDPDGVRCHYFRNAGGRFYGDLEPFFTFPGTNTAFVDSTDHWQGWAENIPDFDMRDVPSPDHTTMLSDPASAREIVGFCGELYR